jgi:hypothetical protein
MATLNPFVAGLQSFAADPEGEAKGRYIMANTAKTQNEADILADRKKWRTLFGGATDITPTAKAGELSNDKVDAGAAYAATGVGSGQRMLFDTDAGGNLVPKATPPSAKDVGLASILLSRGQPTEVVSRMLSPTGGFDKPLAPAKTDYKLHEFTDANTGIHYRQAANADGSPKFKGNGEPEMVALNPSSVKKPVVSLHEFTDTNTGIHYRQVANADGSPKFDASGKPEMVALNQNTVKTSMPSAAGGNVLQTSQAAGAAPVTTTLKVPGSQMIDTSRLSQIARLAHANDAASRGLAPDGMTDLEFVIAKRIGHIGPDGKQNANIPMVNPDEVESIKSLADTIMGGDATIPLSVAVSAAIDHHKDLAAGRTYKGDYDKGLGWWITDFETDANKQLLPQYKDKHYTTSSGYIQKKDATPAQKARGKYSDLPDDAKVVPLSVRLAGDAIDETGIAQLLASNNTGQPVFSTTLPEKPTDMVAGQFYHKGGKFYIAEFGAGGAVTARLITNIKK